MNINTSSIEIICNKTPKITATEHNLLIHIVTQDMEETIALRRTIATDTNHCVKDVDENCKLNDVIGTEHEHKDIFIYGNFY